MRYAFDKWYMEVKDHTGSIGFVIFSQIQAGPLHIAQVKGYLFSRLQKDFAFEHSFPPGTRYNDRTNRIRLTQTNTDFSLMIQHRDFHFRYHAVGYSVQQGYDCSHTIPVDDDHKTIRWEPILMDGSATGYLQFNNRQFELAGAGYVDRVHSEIYPWNVPVECIAWGHGRSGPSSLVYTVTGTNHQTEGKIMFSRDDGLLQIFMLEEKTGLSLPGEENGVPGVLTFTGTGDDGTAILRIRTTHQLFRSRYFEDPEGKWNPVRKFLYRISNRPRGMKYFSEMELIFPSDSRQSCKFPDSFSELVWFSGTSRM